MVVVGEGGFGSPNLASTYYSVFIVTQFFSLSQRELTLQRDAFFGGWGERARLNSAAVVRRAPLAAPTTDKMETCEIGSTNCLDNLLPVKTQHSTTPPPQTAWTLSRVLFFFFIK